MSKKCGCKNNCSTDIKSEVTSKHYHENVKNKADEHTPYGEKEPSTHTEYK